MPVKDFILSTVITIDIWSAFLGVKYLCDVSFDMVCVCAVIITLPKTRKLGSFYSWIRDQKKL